MEEPRWIEKAKATHSFHRSKLLSNNHWTISDTAKALRRGFGSVCEDLMLAKWLKTHENQLSKFKYAYQAIRYIKERKAEMELEMFE